MSFDSNQTKLVKQHFALDAKIDSYDKYAAANAACRFGGSYHGTSYQTFDASTLDMRAYKTGMERERYVGRLSTDADITKVWWAMREHTRIVGGVYLERTEVMRNLINTFSLWQYFIAVSPTEPSMVIYTPDADTGMKDKQVKTTFGRLFRRLLPLITDNQLRVLEEAHLSELDPSFLLASTVSEIEHTYRNMEGDSGCMRYNPSEFGLPEGMHPSHAYCAPGMGVAYIKQGDTIKARAVVWVNPSDASDKRYVRIYGDGKLRTKLERNGYKCADLSGAALALIPVPDSDRNTDTHMHIVVPYLDGPGGRQETPDGAYGYVNADKGTVELVTAQQAQDIRNVTGFDLPRFKSTSTKHVVPRLATSDLSVTCAITGVTYEFQSASKLSWLNVIKVVDGQPVVARGVEMAVKEAGYDQGVYAFNKNNNRVMVRMTPTMMSELCVELPNGYKVLKGDVQEMKRHGFRLLSETYYPAGTFAKADDCRDIPTDGGIYGDCVLNSDTYNVINFTMDGASVVTSMTSVHTSKMIELKKTKQYAAVPTTNGTKTWAHIDHPYLVHTASGKKAVRGTHDVVELFDGRWEFARNVRSFIIYGVTYYYVKSVTSSEGGMQVFADPAFLFKMSTSRDVMDNLVLKHDRYVNDRPDDENASKVYWDAKFNETVEQMNTRTWRSLSRQPIGDYYVKYDPALQYLSCSNYSYCDMPLQTLAVMYERIDALTDADIEANHGEHAVLPMRLASLYGKRVLVDHYAAVGELTARKNAAFATNGTTVTTATSDDTYALAA